MWINLLPLALYPALGWGTPAASLFIGYALLGIEDIGVQIEEPFDVLPLWQYSATVAASCDQLVAIADGNNDDDDDDAAGDGDGAGGGGNE